MGREIKRVALDFNWPINLVWKGFISPYQVIDCKLCEQTGYNEATRQLREGWYSWQNTWRHALTQDEVQALVDEGRLMDFTHTWTKENGWERDPSKPIPTADQVNAVARANKGFGVHDSINAMICLETRAKRLGVYGLCSVCEGKGYYWADDKFEELAENWEPIEPPAGEGWQLWETVSEGSPMSPVFKTPEELAGWLVATKDDPSREHDIQRETTYDSWLKFIKGSGWAMSGVFEDGQFKNGVEAAIMVR